MAGSGHARADGPVALSGTPGTGKSRVARELASTLRSVEVAELAGAPARGASRRKPIEVDLARLRRSESRKSVGQRAQLYVGHLAHLLPCREVVLLRCHPLELARRLETAERGTVRDRRENVAAEATDVVLVEALALRRRVWEIDTTSRTVRSVATEVGRLFRERPPSRYGTVDWLADPSVTDYLLRPAR